MRYLLKRLASHIRINPIGVTTRGAYENYYANAYFGYPVLLNKRNISSVVEATFNGKLCTEIAITGSGNTVGYFVEEPVEYFENVLT